jgi:hypothetical protein
LEQYLATITAARKVRSVCDVLKNINELRKGYPTHTDNTNKYLSAHDFFRISYPIQDFPAAWDSVLGSYFRAIKLLRDILSSARTLKAQATSRKP